MADNMYTADRRLYQDADGNVVEADDPKRVKLLVGVGGQIPLADAERYGLVEVTPAQVKAKAPGSNKAKAPGSNKGSKATKPISDNEQEHEGTGEKMTPIDHPADGTLSPELEAK